jgi:sulfite dehydrogenase (quinone) subunit SoeC
MHPAFSVISFTTLLGAAQGLLVILGLLQLSGVEIPQLLAFLCVAIALLIVSLAASFFHLGHPERAWRAAAMWRTSWLSREVIVLPAFIGVTGLWALLEWSQAASAPVITALIVLLIGLSFLLWICTAMIYACLKFIQEWAHPLTIVNYVLIGMASGLVLSASLLAIAGGNAETVAMLVPWAIGFTLLALASRWASIQRNKRIKPLSTLQSATGIQNPTLRQVSMGMSAGAFNTREFFHGATQIFLRNVKSATLLIGFIAPAALLLLGHAFQSTLLIAIAFPVQYLGLLCERWLFFAQARHPQNLYYQTVS